MMKKGFYVRLAANNIRKNGKLYIPYLFTCVLPDGYVLCDDVFKPGSCGEKDVCRGNAEPDHEVWNRDRRYLCICVFNVF